MEINEETPPAQSPPLADLNEARIQDEDDKEDFFGSAEKMSLDYFLEK